MTHKIIIESYLKVVCFLVILSVCSCQALFPQITTEEANEVKNICNNLKPPPFFAETHLTDVVKSSGSVRSINYSSLALPSQVEEYYVSLLTKSGWSYQKERGAAEDFLRFKKGKYAINITSLRNSITEKRIYLLSCSI